MTGYVLAAGFAICAGIAMRYGCWFGASVLVLWSVLLGRELFWLMHSWARMFLSVYG